MVTSTSLSTSYERVELTHRFELHQQASFLEYIIGGCEINLVVAIDFTGSNGYELNNLHHLRLSEIRPILGRFISMDQEDLTNMYKPYLQLVKFCPPTIVI